MEPAEDASLEPAIRSLVQSILASPLIDERDPWLREAGLAEDMEGLKSAVEGVNTVVFVVKGRAFGNEPLARSLARLKDPLYDADDLVDELHYHRLRLQIEGGTRHDPNETDGHRGASRAERSTENADIPSSSGTLPDPNETDGHGTQLAERSRGNATVRRLKSAKEWEEFEIIEKCSKGSPLRAKCKHCPRELRCPTNQGTGVLRNHLKSKSCPYEEPQGSGPSSTADATTNPSPVATGNTSGRKRMRPDQESTLIIAANKHTWNKDDFSKRIRDITHKLQAIQAGVVGVLKILNSDFAASSNDSQSATSHQHRRTTSVLQGIVYGRDFEKKNIVNLMTEKKSAAGVTVLPIVGIAGVGKTALAQFIYNHTAVKKQFYHKIWIWVSNNFDAMRLTKDMLGYVSKETHVGLCSFAQLQEILESHIKSKRVLLILDDVWDGINDCQWNQLLTPFNSDNAKGNMIIVTSRKPCVAKIRGTEKPITLGALENNHFWLFFKACAFGAANHEEQESLSGLGWQIAKKLKGNPLAARTAGGLLREHHTVDHWSSILKNEDWKSLTLSGSIMSALKLCYDQLPYYLQQCFSYCSLFPCNYKFLAEELVRIWISQGFVKCNNSSKRLDEIGQHYLTDLVNLGFFEQVEKKSSSGCTQICYVMYNLMHDFARVVSRAEYATIDGWQCNMMLATVRHLSIIINSVYHMEDQTGNIACSEKFEETLRNTVASLGKLRSLVLIGQYDSIFFQSFQTTFQKAHNLRLLHLSSTSADFHPFMRNLVNPTHLRYLKLEVGHAEQEALTQVLRKSFHLEVLDVNQYSDTRLSSSRMVHQVNSGERQILLSLEKFRFLTRLKLSKMQNVREILVPSLEELVFVEMPELKTCSCTSVGDLRSSLRVLEVQSCPALEVFDLFQNGRNYQTEHNSWLPSLRKLSLENFRFLTRLKLSRMQNVREVLVPSLEELVLVEMPELKTCSCTSVGDLKSSLRVLEIQSCPALEVFDLFQKGRYYQTEHNSWLRSLRKLIIRDCPNLHVLILLRPSATSSELLISGVSTMEGSSSQTLKIKPNSVLGGSPGEIMALYDKFLAFHNMRDLKYLEIKNCLNLGSILARTFGHLISLRSLRIESCSEHFSPDVVREYTHEDVIPSNDDALPSLESLSIKSCKITGKWLSLMLRHVLALKELSLDGCLELTHLRFEEEGNIQSNLISAVEASPSEYGDYSLTNSALDGLWHIPLNLASSLKKITICECHVIFNGRREGFAGFTTLEELTIKDCPELLSSLVHNDGQANGRWFLPQSLGQLEIDNYPQQTLRPCFVGNLTCLNFLKVSDSPCLKSLQLDSCTAMEDLSIDSCQRLVELEGMQSLGILTDLTLEHNSDLKFLQLHSCTSLKNLVIGYCCSLVALKGVRSLVNLTYLSVIDCPDLDSLTTSGESCEQMEGISSDSYTTSSDSYTTSGESCEQMEGISSDSYDTTSGESCEQMEGISSDSYELFPALEVLQIDSLSLLAPSFCKGLTRLQTLDLLLYGDTRLTNKQKRALLLLRSLQDLRFMSCSHLKDLPAGLQGLPCLKKLTIDNCKCITRLPKKGLPPSLEELEICDCSSKLSNKCRSLATSKLKVKIDGLYVN